MLMPITIFHNQHKVEDLSKKFTKYNELAAHKRGSPKVLDWLQGHHQLSGKSDENKSFNPNQSAPSIYIMTELCYFPLDQ